MKKTALSIIFLTSILALLFTHSGNVYSQARAIYCAKLGLPNAVGQCNASCQVYCPAGYQTCDRNYNGAGAFGSCIVPDRACAWQLSDGTRRTTSGACCCPVPTVTPTPYLCGTGNCSGCCLNNICFPGTKSFACGVQGALCTDCIPHGDVCVNQTCVLRPVTPTPIPRRLSCWGQYFGKPQCDWRAPSAYGKGGICQLNSAFGTINLSNLNDPINYWKWSYCR